MLSEVISPALIEKYNQPTPRYTSYPTLPYWKEKIDQQEWKSSFQQQFHIENAENGISLYIHLPFCESLCTYCGCNKKITTNHKVEEKYVAVIEKEWHLYRKMMKQTPVIREFHLGGGTPTFFSVENLQRLIHAILKNSILHPQYEFSIEGHPNNTTKEHLEVLHKAGFRRISFGVQDLDPEVQLIINRIQPFEKVKEVTIEAREQGFTSVNFDLIYGLPLQTIKSIEETITSVLTLRPDRIAYYSYAHVPWNSKSQRLIDETLLPTATEKIVLYLKGKELLLKAGYIDVGMDHFALPSDELTLAGASGKLYRNFMGYTAQNARFLIGLGVSSISDTGISFAQNHKKLEDYYTSVNNGELAVKKGYFSTEEDISFRRYIIDISCKGKALLKKEDENLLEEYSFPVLRQLAEDELVTMNQGEIMVTSKGHFFLRTICSAFDISLQRNNREGKSKIEFSKAI